MYVRKVNHPFFAALLLGALVTPLWSQKTTESWPEHIQLVLDNTRPLQCDRGRRLPLYLWPAMNPGPLSPDRAEALVHALDRRGVGLVCTWRPDRRQDCLAECLPMARAQKKLGLRININANPCLYSFFDDTPQTAHQDEKGQPFWDRSFANKKIGCPFTLRPRRAVIRERIVWYAEAYAREGLAPGFVFADWEIDGPLEWNEAWEHAKKCRRCRQHIPQIDANFLQFQKILRDLRSDLQWDVYARPLRDRFPAVLVGNYAVYPHDGYRYWYDYFEKVQPGLPALVEQKARYRHWANEFEKTGFTFAMPTVYPWSWTWHWYDYESADYRWFYNLLKVASNAARHTPSDVPLVPFVHWHTVMVGDEADRRGVRQFSEKNYRELLWHMLLRGHDTFFLWCSSSERLREVRLLHPVWAAAQQYGEFLDRGVPVNYEVPPQPGPVVSGLRLGNRLLIRRTDFTDHSQPIDLTVAGRPVSVPPAPGECRIITLE